MTKHRRQVEHGVLGVLNRLAVLATYCALWALWLHGMLGDGWPALVQLLLGTVGMLTFTPEAAEAGVNLVRRKR